MAHSRNLLGFVTLVMAALLFGCAGGKPRVRDPGVVTAEGALGTPVLLASGESTVYARIRIGTVPRPQEGDRAPVNVALAIDTSGSMEGAAIEAARNAALQMIASLKDGDRLAVIAFHTNTEILLASKELDSQVRADVTRAVKAIKAQGTTDLAGGLSAAVGEVRHHFVKNGLNRVVLLGDGIPNHLNGIDYATQAAAADGIAITTLGLGLDYDEMLMGKIAQRTGGRFKYIDEPEKVAGFFRDELQRIDAVYARHATAHLTAGPGVQIERVVGGHGSGSQAHVTLGDIARGDTRDVIVRLTVKPRKAGVPIELLDVQIRFEDAVADAGRIERRVYLGAHTVEEEVLVEKARKPEIELAAALAEAAASTMLALETSKQGFNVRARQMLEKASEAALAQTKRTPSKELEKHAADMLAVAKDLPSADAPPPPLPAKKPEEMQLGDDSLSAPLETPMPTLEVPLPPESSRRIKQMHQQSIDYFQPAPSK